MVCDVKIVSWYVGKQLYRIREKMNEEQKN